MYTCISELKEQLHSTPGTTNRKTDSYMYTHCRLSTNYRFGCCGSCCKYIVYVSTINQVIAKPWSGDIHVTGDKLTHPCLLVPSS